MQYSCHIGGMVHYWHAIVLYSIDCSPFSLFNCRFMLGVVVRGSFVLIIFVLCFFKVPQSSTLGKKPELHLNSTFVPLTSRELSSDIW